MNLLNYRIFRFPAIALIIAFFAAIPLHYFLNYIFSLLFKIRVSDIEVYLCCTNILTETRSTGYGLIFLALMSLFLSFYLEKKC